MALKRITLVSIALTAAVAGLSGISYVRPLHTAFSLSHDTQCRLTVADGNLRLVWLRAEFMASYIGYSGYSALDKYCRQTRRSGFDKRHRTKEKLAGTE